MVSAKTCCNNTCFAILSLLTVGLTFAGVILILVYVLKFKVKEYSQGFYYTSIILVCAGFILLAFAIYASFCGKKCAKTVISIIYILYALFLIGIAIVCFCLSSLIYTSLASIWKNSSETDIESAKTIEKAFKCCTYNISYADITNCTKEHSEYQTCEKAIKDKVNFPMIGGIVLGLGILLLVATFCALCIACNDKGAEASHSQFDTPLNYGW